MSLLGMLADEDYLPEYGTVVVRDRHDPDGLAPLPNELLGELATDALTGTIATAGDGWLHGAAGDPDQSVRLEAHDAEPPVTLAEWEDVVETPFRSRSGRVALGLLTGGDFGDALELGRRGLFSARVARRAAGEGDLWLIQFWPSDAPALPRWVKRTRPAVGVADPGWQVVLGYQVMEVGWFAGGSGPARPESWYDEPLPSDDLDPAICAQLGVPVPATRRDAVALLVAAGLLVPDGDGHRWAESSPSATQRLELRAELTAQLDQSALRSQYVWLGADLTSIAAWGDPAPVDGLAGRLLIPAHEIAPLLAYAESDRLIRRGADGIRALPRKRR